MTAVITIQMAGDEKIKLEGLPEGYKYTFMHAEIDTAEPEEPDTEVPDSDILPPSLVEEFEDVSEDPQAFDTHPTAYLTPS